MTTSLASFIVLVAFIFYFIALIALPDWLALLIFNLRVSWSKFAKIVGIELAIIGIELTVLVVMSKVGIPGSLGAVLSLLLLTADVFIWIKLLKHYVPDRYSLGKAIGSYITSYVIALVNAPVIAIFMVAFIGQSFRIDGNSMFPALHENEKVLVYKFEKRPSDNLIIVYKIDTDDEVLGRVHGTPGQTVAISQGQVIVEGHTENVKSYTLSANQYYVTVDNASNNNPPRIISSNSIVGTVGLKL